MGNNKYHFSMKSKVKRILGISLIFLILVCIGLGIYLHFFTREENLYKKYLKNTNYQFLERFYDGQSGNKHTYVLKGIIYNVRKTDDNIVFDINAWDLDTKESLYFTDIELSNIAVSEGTMEDILYEFEPVSMRFEFEEKNLTKLNIEKLSFTGQQYKYASETLWKFLTSGYSSRVDESGYSDVLPVNVINENGRVSVLPVYVNTDALFGLYGLSLLSTSERDDSGLNVEEYITETVNRIKSQSEEKGIDELRLPGSCTLMYKLRESKVYPSSQLDRLLEVFCNKSAYEAMSSKGGYESSWEELSSFIDSNSLDVNYEPGEVFTNLMYLSDIYSFSKIYGEVLDSKKVENMENLIARSILSSSKDTKTYNIPYKTLCSLSYALKEVPEGTDIEKYSDLLNKLGGILNDYGNRKDLLESFEKDTKSGLMCVAAFEDSMYADIRNLMESVLLKMYYVDIYSVADEQGNFYNGAWSKSSKGYPMLAIEDNVRYYNLLRKVYDKK